MHASIHISMAVKPSAFGEFVVMLLKMLIRTRKSVIRSAIRPKILHTELAVAFLFFTITEN